MRKISLKTPSSDRRLRKGFLVLSLVLVIAGCSGTATPSATPNPTLNPTLSPTVAATTAPVATPAPTEAPEPTLQNAFPRTVVDDEGTSVTVPVEPQRIVSLTPANTEIVFELGAGDLLVGGTDSDDYPPEAAALPDVVQGITVLTEQIVDLEADLVLAGGNNFTPPAEVQRLRDLGIPVVVVYPQTLDQVMGDITLIGEATGLNQAAQDTVTNVDTRVDEVTSAVDGLEQPRVFYEIGYGPDIYGPAPESFIADMVVLAGGDPILTDDPAVFSIPLEQLISRDPEIIVLGDAAYTPPVCPNSISERDGWDVMTAVQNGDIRPVNDLIVTRPGPRIGEGLAALALAIHPDIEIAPVAFPTDLCGS